jgi:hypothetical protein
MNTRGLVGRSNGCATRGAATTTTLSNESSVHSIRGQIEHRSDLQRPIADVPPLGLPTSDAVRTTMRGIGFQGSGGRGESSTLFMI